VVQRSGYKRMTYDISKISKILEDYGLEYILDICDVTYEEALEALIEIGLVQLPQELPVDFEREVFNAELETKD
jgi:hypothetical protein